MRGIFPDYLTEVTCLGPPVVFGFVIEFNFTTPRVHNFLRRCRLARTPIKIFALVVGRSMFHLHVPRQLIRPVLGKGGEVVRPGRQTRSKADNHTWLAKNCERRPFFRLRMTSIMLYSLNRSDSGRKEIVEYDQFGPGLFKDNPGLFVVLHQFGNNAGILVEKSVKICIG